ncbi:hypothetical protein DS884_00125 [Tenacibaculum sp. E3R01]|uniref:DUF4738 domain-containing protein n=1 Tax=Tenacibaculum sp. E3R01 TaxID=2267227 RepID=UPI000DEAC036|nr:DUF4738 domain-containing protein [Tenacibaculum sp. E3R01]RBW63430.1 hypothetical protein DS884_00125 [Tenacibaculum sp. E3R01]
MKQLLILIITFSIISSCDRKKSEKTQSELKQKTELKTATESEPKTVDTIEVYYPTEFDTIQNFKEVQIESDKLLLGIKTYSLNDSSIVNINGNYKETYHNYVSQITLTKLKDTILKTQINKSIFKDSLNSEFYRRCTFDGIEYNGIRSNRIYFKGYFSVPDTDWAFGNEFAIFYRTEKKNQVNSWNFKDIGL